VFGIDERGEPARLLRLGDDLQGQGGLAGGLRAVDFGDAAAREAADAERVVDADGAGRDGFHGRDRVALPEAHDRALAELLFDLADGHVEGLESFLSFVDCHVCWVPFRPAVILETDQAKVKRKYV
jgi:hypothetical protein